MKIGEYSKVVGLSKDTIRYYEKIGLIQPNMVGTHRNYTEEDIDDIVTIVKLKRNGFSLLEIKAMFELTDDIDKDQEMSTDDLDKVLQLQAIFNQKHNDMVEREKEILEIKTVLKKAGNKIEYLLEKIL